MSLRAFGPTASVYANFAYKTGPARFAYMGGGDNESQIMLDWFDYARARGATSPRRHCHSALSSASIGCHYLEIYAVICRHCCHVLSK
jgi:hypothetical protein